MKLPIILAALALAGSANARVFVGHCTTEPECINKPGLIMDGFPTGHDDTVPLRDTAGGSVNINGAMATPAFIVAAADGVVIYRVHGLAYVVSPAAVFVNCPARRAWLGAQNFPFTCPR